MKKNNSRRQSPSLSSRHSRATPAYMPVCTWNQWGIRLD